MAKRNSGRTFKVFSNFNGTQWGYKVYEGKRFVCNVQGFDSYKEAYWDGINSGHKCVDSRR